ncbi:MAG TPA: RNA polymerase factor sigma-54 [Candidatus Polarisedimenticolia bacterium]|jgi:RNA polymerase sigma-54 factor|nr:RNA polymerase factor sigma-54 [Candidatus Polarisedimenticolia bacterium]
MALEQKLNMRLATKLVMTPSLQQAIKLLQMSKLELVEEINQELTLNPVLEEAGETREEQAPEPEVRTDDPGPAPEPAPDGVKDSFQEIDYQSYFQDYMDAGYSPRAPTEEIEAPPLENILTRPQSLSDHLLWQLSMNVPDGLEQEIGRAIIGNLDENGYLKASLEEIESMGSFPPEKVAEVLAKIQEFDPTGVAARDLQECLLIQIRAFDMEETPQETIIRDHMDLLQGRKFRELAQALKCSPEEVQEYLEIIRALDPRPGKRYDSDRSTYVIPDVFVYKVDKGYTIVLNEEGLPRLRVSSFYRRMVDKGNTDVTREARDYVREKLSSALRLIKSLEERQRTIYKVARSIVSFQRKFLDYGFEYLRPLILKDVAEDIQMHESTVSRVVNNKYMHTPRGVFEMRFFFHSGIASAQGEDVSSLTVKERIKKLVSEENAGRPLSDSALAKLLGDEGLQIARRTVAKYREELRIPSSNDRRQGFR